MFYHHYQPAEGKFLMRHTDHANPGTCGERDSGFGAMPAGVV